MTEPLDLTGEIALDIESLTLGELTAIERASGQDAVQLIQGRAGRRLVGLFIFLLRRDGRAPSWPRLANLRLTELPRSGSPSRPAGPSGTSSD